MQLFQSNSSHFLLLLAPEDNRCVIYMGAEFIHQQGGALSPTYSPALSNGVTQSFF